MTEPTVPYQDTRPGDMVFDVGQDDVPMVVVDTDLPPVAGLEGDLGRAVRTNTANKEVGFTDETECARAVYVDVDSEPKKPYTFPVTRLCRPRVESAERVDGTAYELAAAHFLRQLLASLPNPTVRLDVLDCAKHQTDLTDSAISYADNMAELDRKEQ